MLHLAIVYTKRTHMMEFGTLGNSKNMYNTAGFPYFIDTYSQHTYLSLDIHMVITSAYFMILISVIF